MYVYALAANGIKFTDEHDARGLRLGLLEEVPHEQGTHTDAEHDETRRARKSRSHLDQDVERHTARHEEQGTETQPTLALEIFERASLPPLPAFFTSTDGGPLHQH